MPDHRCADLDADCFPIEDKIGCWLYDVNKGYCPWLRRHSEFNGMLVSAPGPGQMPEIIKPDGTARVLEWGIDLAAKES